MEPLDLTTSGTFAVDAADAATTPQRLVAAFLSGRSPRTIAAYREDLEYLRRHLGLASAEEVATRLLSRGMGAANALVLEYRTSMVERGLAPATVNRRLSAVRSLVKLARTLWLVTWELEIPSLRSETYRDTRGPGVEGYRAMLRVLSARSGPKAARDTAIVRLLFDLALRRIEVVRLDLEDVDLAAGTISILGKGRTQRELVTLPAPTQAALAAWIAVRGGDPGPLFTNFCRAVVRGRLTGRGLHKIVAKLGKDAGLGRCWPHGLRHAAITQALDVTKGDVRAVQRFSRHRSVGVLLRYDDARRDLAGEVARQVAGAVESGA